MRVRITKKWQSTFPDDKGFDINSRSYDEEGTSCDRCATSIKYTVDVVHSRNKQTATVGTRCAEIVTKPYSRKEILEFIEGDLIGIDPYSFNHHWEKIDHKNGRLYRYTKLNNATCEILEEYSGTYIGKIKYEKPLDLIQKFEADDPTDIRTLRSELFRQYRNKHYKTP